MKKYKNILLILALCLFIFLNSTVVFALMAYVTYNTVNIIIYSIMRFAIIIVILSYIIFQIIYFKKSDKEKNEKMKKSIYGLIITIVVILGLWLGANLVLKAGAIYTSIPRTDSFYVPNYLPKIKGN